MGKHIEDLFKRGEEVEITADSTDGEIKFRIWMTKPTSAEHQSASLAARAAQASKRVLLSDSDGFREVIEQDIPREYDDVIDILLAYETDQFNRQAYEEVLHNPDVGSNWSDDGGFDLLALLDAMSVRVVAIQEHNESAGEDDKIDLEDDEQYSKVSDRVKQFFDEVDVRSAELREDASIKLRTFSYDELKRQAVDKYIDLEARAAWYDEYRYQMVYLSCHYHDNKKRKYFSSLDAVKSLDEYVFVQLWDAYENLSIQGSDLKK